MHQEHYQHDPFFSTTLEKGGIEKPWPWEIQEYVGRLILNWASFDYAVDQKFIEQSKLYKEVTGKVLSPNMSTSQKLVNFSALCEKMGMNQEQIKWAKSLEDGCKMGGEWRQERNAIAHGQITLVNDRFYFHHKERKLWIGYTENASVRAEYLLRKFHTVFDPNARASEPSNWADEPQFGIL